MSSSKGVEPEMMEESRKLKRKAKKQRTTSKGLSEEFITGIITLTVFVIIFLFMAGHSHVQLDLMNESSKIFVKNKFGVLRKELDAMENAIINYSTEIRQDIASYVRPLTEEQMHPISTLGNTLLTTTLSDDADDVPDKANTGEQVVAHDHHHVLTCPHNELVTFWESPSLSDRRYKTPYEDNSRTKYVTFEPDVGGWNNIRMQMELVLVFAASTGRTLVLPPDQPMYLLNQGVGHQKAHSFADFFPFKHISKVLPVITMEEFMEREAITGHLSRQWDFHNYGIGIEGEVMYPPGNKTEFVGTIRDDRLAMWDYLRNVTTCAPWKSPEEFIILPSKPLSATQNGTKYFVNNVNHTKRYRDFEASRQSIVYDSFWHEQKVIHFISKPAIHLRLLQPFYTFMFFEDIHMDLFYKRFIRDYVHYLDEIFCKAAIIVNSLQNEGSGHYSSFHIRRGEFQYAVVKISAAELMKNVAHLIPHNELLYIASDEKNKTFFNDFRKKFPQLRFLDDYMDVANLRDVNPNYLGMIEQVVCSLGRVFVGTWFSTFSSYITRMRGYHGLHDYSVYYGDKGHRDRFHTFELPKFPFYMREWNVSWADIDEDIANIN